MEEIKNDLFENLYANSGLWFNFNNKGKFIPWKIHVFADNKKDLIFMLDKILPYLITENIHHKFIHPDKIDGINHSIQKGKAIVIYPPNKQMFMEILIKLDYRFTLFNLTLTESNISGSKKYGDSGRLFYRYELDSGKYKNMNFDSSNEEMMYIYNKHYQKNRGGDNYLASDMSEDDDLF